MKRICIVLLLAALLTACLPTPEHEIIENKGDKKDWQVEAQPISDTVGTPIDAPVKFTDYEQQEGPLYERLNAPKLWSMENNDYGFSIVAKDSPVYLPDVHAVPILEAELREITQADVDAVIAEMFHVDGIKWYPEVGFTKEDCINLIRGVQEELDNAEPGSEEYQYQKKRLEEYTEYYTKLYELAPFASQVEPVEPLIGVYQDGYDRDKDKNLSPHYTNGLNLHTTVAGEKWELRAFAGDEIYGNSVCANRNGDLWSDSEQPLDAPYGVKMTRSEALGKASEIAERLTGGELTPCYCAPMYFHSNDWEKNDLTRRWSQWRVTLMRTFNGVGTAYASEEIGGSMNSTVTKPIAYEKITVDLDDQGVTSISWVNPMRITGVVNADASLLSFEEAADKAMKHVAAYWKPYVESMRSNGEEITIYIHRVTLGLWRIAKKNGGWYYVPVYQFFADPTEGRWCTTGGFWDRPGTPRERFLNTLKHLEAGDSIEYPIDPPSGNCLTFGAEYWGGITVNALDGTIIDKDLGY